MPPGFTRRGRPEDSNILELIKFQTWSTFGYSGVSYVPMYQTNLAAVGTNWHTVNLAFYGNQIAVYYDTNRVMSVTDNDTQAAPYTSGGVSVDSWTYSTEYTMSVENVTVSQLVANDSYSTAENTALTVSAPGVLANDTEVLGKTLTAILATSPTNGTLNLSTNGGFTYTPNAGYTGPDSFTYQANDGTVNLGIATVYITVNSGITRPFYENFDEVAAPALPSGWTTSATGVETPWVTSTTASDTAPNAAYVPDPANVGDSYLVSPVIALPGGQARLIFRNNYNLESDASDYYDGGVLEIKIGAGTFTDILAAGGSFVSGGYNGTISTLYGNSLAGHPAWSGNSGGFVTTMVDLPAAAESQSIQLRWHCATDSGNGNPDTNGWYIDTVAITNCACACCWSTPPLLPVQTNQTVNELTTLTVTNTATDLVLPPPTLTYTLISPPAGATIGTNTGIITWTPSQTQSPSTNTFKTTVTDNGSPPLSATNSFTVTVREVNVAPTLPIIAAQTVNELALLTVTNTATNANIHSTISGYTLVSPPAGASISTNGIITWTPSPTEGPSTNTLTTVVTNANPYDLVNPHLTATNSFTVVVLSRPLIVLTSAVLVAESCLPTNGVIDPGETVTVFSRSRMWARSIPPTWWSRCWPPTGSRGRAGRKPTAYWSEAAPR